MFCHHLLAILSLQTCLTLSVFSGTQKKIFFVHIMKVIVIQNNIRPHCMDKKKNSHTGLEQHDGE